MFKTFWLFVLRLLGIKRSTVAQHEVTQAATWNPFLTAAVERERRAMIYKRLRTFMQMKPRPGHSPNALATIRKRMRRNAQRIMQARLHSRRGIQ